MSVLTSEKVNLQQQIQTLTEKHQKNMETTEIKHSKLKAECERIRLANTATQAEFESYKTRVHSVLKQQKSKPAQPAELEPSEK